MDTLVALLVFLFYVTPLFIIGWGIKCKKALGSKSLEWAAAAMTVWLIKAGYVYYGAMSGLGGHSVKAGDEYKNIAEGVMLLGIDLLVIASLYIKYKNSTINEKTLHGEQASFLNGLFEKSDELIASVTRNINNEESKTTAIINSEENEFVVRLVMETNGYSQSFRNYFDTLDDVATFLENNTPFKINDFAKNA